MEPTTVRNSLQTLGKEEEPGYKPTPMPLDIQIPIAIAILLLIIIAIIGNVMTIVAYITDRHLHTVYNYYIFHLAIADLLLAAISMSFHSIYLLKGMMWPFGEVACKIWIGFDYTLCLQTNFMMIILSIDRILLVSLGMKYSRVVTMKRANVQMLVSWCVCFFTYYPLIIWWADWTGESWVSYDIDCDVEFAANPILTTMLAMVSSLLPLVGLSILNMFLYIKIRNRNRIMPKQDGSAVQTAKTVNVMATSSDVINANDCYKYDRGQGQGVTTSSVEDNHNKKTNQGKPIPSRRDAKAFRFLAILVIAFLVCWGPYTVMLIVTSFCEATCVDVHVHEFLVWLLWTKSAINPFLYAFNSQVYRGHFKRYIMFWKRW